MIKYVINRKKNIVVAYFQDETDENRCGRDLLHKELCWMLFSRLQKSEFASFVSMEDITSILYDFVSDFMRTYVPEENCIRGIAKCSPEDSFSEFEGKRIAKERLINKERHIFKRMEEYFNEKIEKIFTELLIGRG